MNIQLSLYVVSVIIFPIVFLILFCQNNYHSIKTKKVRTVDDIFNKNETTSLKGASALIICFHHFSQYAEVGDTFKAINIYRYVGFIIVALFLFISGYASYISYKNKADKGIRQTSLISKVLRIYMSWVIVSLCVFYVTYHNLDCSFLKTIRYICFFGLTIYDGYINASWFLIAICYLLASFEISVQAIKKKNNINLLVILLVLFTMNWVAVCKLLGVGYWWYITIIAYPFGVFVAIYKQTIVNVIQKNYYAFICLNVFAFTLLFNLWLKQISLVTSWTVSLTFCLLIFALSCKFNFESKIFNNIGIISLEFFAVHINVLDILLYFGSADNLIFILALALTYILSIILHRLDSCVAKIINL